MGVQYRNFLGTLISETWPTISVGFYTLAAGHMTYLISLKVICGYSLWAPTS
jgi:hypothetical protein